MIYFISDTHFNHKGTLKWADGKNRNFPDIQTMNQTIINNWNSIVKIEDTVYFLGDFAFKTSKTYAETIFWELNGKKHLIKGNHDYNIASKFINCWESISDIKQVDFINDKGCIQEIILCHYPMLSWRHKNQGAWHLHGHTHGSLQELNKNTNRMDVSVEAINYTPISIEEVIKKLNLNKDPLEAI